MFLSLLLTFSLSLMPVFCYIIEPLAAMLLSLLLAFTLSLMRPAPWRKSQHDAYIAEPLLAMLLSLLLARLRV